MKETYSKEQRKAAEEWLEGKDIHTPIWEIVAHFQRREKLTDEFADAAVAYIDALQADGGGGLTDSERYRAVLNSPEELARKAVRHGGGFYSTRDPGGAP